MNHNKPDKPQGGEPELSGSSIVELCKIMLHTLILSPIVRWWRDWSQPKSYDQLTKEERDEMVKFNWLGYSERWERLTIQTKRRAHSELDAVGAEDVPVTEIIPLKPTRPARTASLAILFSICFIIGSYFLLLEPIATTLNTSKGDARMTVSESYDDSLKKDNESQRIAIGASVYKRLDSTDYTEKGRWVENKNTYTVDERVPLYKRVLIGWSILTVPLLVFMIYIRKVIGGTRFISRTVGLSNLNQEDNYSDTDRYNVHNRETTLYVEPDDVPALSFYEAHGYDGYYEQPDKQREKEAKIQDRIERQNTWSYRFASLFLWLSFISTLTVVPLTIFAITVL